uniref:Endonuclease III homolog n=1 Tax=Trichuris muris TaxID=70415 RepID=A0A5S6Q6T5_TRIMR
MLVREVVDFVVKSARDTKDVASPQMVAMFVCLRFVRVGVPVFTCIVVNLTSATFLNPLFVSLLITGETTTSHLPLRRREAKASFEWKLLDFEYPYKEMQAYGVQGKLLTMANDNNARCPTFPCQVILGRRTSAAKSLFQKATKSLHALAVQKLIWGHRLRYISSSMAAMRTRRRKERTAAGQCDCQGKGTTKEPELLDKEGDSRIVADSWQPPNWLSMLENIEAMRSGKEAPVDTSGCSRLSEPNANPKTKRYQLLLALMLSSQTKDIVTAAAMRRLKEHGCSLENVLAMSEEQLGKLIYPVSFWKTKARMIKKTSRVLLENYDGDIPQTAKELCQLPGVGPKMAYLAVQTAWNRCDGIGVDTHVHRISNRLGFVPKVTKTPEQTRKALESWLPKQYWSSINELLVGFGQTVCQPRYPKCQSCLNVDICPYARNADKQGAKTVKTTP